MVVACAVIEDMRYEGVRTALCVRGLYLNRQRTTWALLNRLRTSVWGKSGRRILSAESLSLFVHDLPTWTRRPSG